MKLSISLESVAELREWSEQLSIIDSNLLLATSTLNQRFQAVRNVLGPHSQQFGKMISAIINQQEVCSESLRYLRIRLADTADEIEDFLYHNSSEWIAGNGRDQPRDSKAADIGAEDSNTHCNLTDSGNETNAENLKNDVTAHSSSDGENNGDLSEAEKAEIQQESGWSDEIVNAIRSKDEYEIYKNAGLKESEVDGKKCLIRDDIDWNQKDTYGRTNHERVEQNLSPENTKGETIYLHHIGQRNDSPIAELNFAQHRQNGNDIILHDKKRSSEVHGNGTAWPTEKSHYWKCRSHEVEDT